MDGHSALISAAQAGTLDGLFRERIAQSPHQVAYRHFDRETKRWVDTTWQEMAKLTGHWYAALKQEKLSAGDRVAVLLKNCREWVAFEQAALGLGLVVVPLYMDDRPDNIAYIIRDAGVRLLVMQDIKQWQRLAPLKEALPTIQRFVVLEGELKDDELDEENASILVAAENWLPDTSSPLKERGGDPDDLATIVYTSGTTGRPKGVMLSHKNILSNSEMALRSLEIYPPQTLLSFMPLSHTLERTTGYYLPMMANFTVCYSRSIQQLAEDIKTLQPSAMIAVPRIFERIYDKVQSKLASSPPHKRALFNLTIRTGLKRFERMQGRAGFAPSLLLWPLLNKLVAAPFREILGGRLDLVVSGGAALPLPVAKVFLGMGLTVLQGYGMTESSPVVSVNVSKRNQPNSVGPALQGVEVRLGENDELQVMSPGIMLGYWNNHQATTETLTSDGWLRTGDKAEINEQGFIRIVGRIKDIMVLSNGEKIPPGDMESAISMDPLFEQVLIIGEGRPYLSALVVLNPEQWVVLAKELKLDPFNKAHLSEKVLSTALLRRIADNLHDFPGYAKVRRVTPLLEPWTIENGMITPSMKVKRAVVCEQFKSQIEAMYTN